MTTPLNDMEKTVTPERRSHPRKRVTQTIYVELDEGNGGIILNIGEGGLAVQAAMALVYDDLPRIRFRFPNNKNWIKGAGEVVWKGDTKTMAGVKFVDLPEESRLQILEWMNPPAIAETDDVVPAELPANAAAHHNHDGASQIAIASDGAPLSVFSDDLDPVPAAQQQTGAFAAPSARIANAPVEPPSQAPARPPRDTTDHELHDVSSLDSSATRRPRISRSQLKRYLVDERHRIRLYDLVSEQTEKLCAALTEANFPTNVPVTAEEFVRRVRRYEELTDELVSIFITGCFWGEKNQELIWVKLLERVANTAGARSGYAQWLSLQSYPALLLLYAGGVAAIANEKFTTLEALLVKPRLITPDGDCRLVDRLNAATVIEDDRLSHVLNGGERHAPLSAYLCASLRERFREFVPADDVYDDIFDHFEYMFSLVWIDENPVGASLGWIPLGRFAWKHLTGLQYGGSVVGRISAEVSQQGKEWPVFRAGLFGGSMQRFVSARNRVATFMASQR